MKNLSHLPIVQKGVGFNLFFINCCQLGWIVSYCLDLVWLATLLMGINVIILIWLNYNLYYHDYIDRASPSSLEMNDETLQSMTVIYEWLIFRLPFQLHLGLGLFMLLLNFNETSLELNWSISTQIAFVSIIVLWMVGIAVLFFPKSPIFALPLFISWAAVGVWINLRQPSEAVLLTYGPKAVERMHGGIAATCIEHALISLIRFVIFFANSYSLLRKA